MCQWHHHRVRLNAKSRFSAYLEPTYQKIHDAAIPTYEKVLAEYGMRRGFDYKVLKSPYPKIVYLDSEVKHEVHFISAENPDKIVAVEYSHATKDERGIVSKEASQNLDSRVRDSFAIVRQIMNGGAPQGINDFADQFNSDEQSGWNKSVSRDHTFTQVVDGHSIQRRRFIVRTQDNKHLPQGYVAQLTAIYGYNPKLLQSYLYGLFCDFTEGQAYCNYLPPKHDIEDVEPDTTLDIHLSFDFNANPLAWGAFQCRLFWEYSKRVYRYVLTHEANSNNGNIDEACIEFALKHPVAKFANTPIYIYGDSSGHAASHKIRGSDYDMVRKYLHEIGYKKIEIRAARSNPLETESVEAAQRAFLSNVLNICKRCVMTRKSLVATTWKQGTRKLDKPSGETWTHHGDMLKYFAYQVLNDFAGKPSAKVYGVN
jgi:hypothetical protein